MLSKRYACVTNNGYSYALWRRRREDAIRDCLKLFLQRPYPRRRRDESICQIEGWQGDRELFVRPGLQLEYIEVEE